MNDSLRIFSRIMKNPPEHTNARSLCAIISGRVFPVGELFGDFGRVFGEGYAVRPARLTHGAELMSPIDAVVTAIFPREGKIRLRSGDGILLDVLTGSSEANWRTAVGDRLRRGELFCALSRANVEQNWLSGAFAVIFCEPEKITELHIPPAKRRAGERAAFFRVLHGFSG